MSLREKLLPVGPPLTRASLTPRELQVYDTLTDRPQSAGDIAREAGIKTSFPAENAAKYANRLCRLGVAIKSHFGNSKPMWRKRDDVRL